MIHIRRQDGLRLHLLILRPLRSHIRKVAQLFSTRHSIKLRWMLKGFYNNRFVYALSRNNLFMICPVRPLTSFVLHRINYWRQREREIQALLSAIRTICNTWLITRVVSVSQYHLVVSRPHRITSHEHKHPSNWFIRGPENIFPLNLSKQSF